VVVVQKSADLRGGVAARIERFGNFHPDTKHFLLAAAAGYIRHGNAAALS